MTDTMEKATAADKDPPRRTNEEKDDEDDDEEQSDHDDVDEDSENSDDDDYDEDDDDNEEADEVEKQKGNAKRANDKEENAASEPKKARIAMPPPVDSSILNADVYALEEPPSANQNSDVDRIDTSSVILFGLHPLIREPPLKKLCETFGDILSLEIRSALVSRYAHIEYSSVAQAQEAYRAMNGAKLLHKVIIVQPSKPASTPLVTAAVPTATAAEEAPPSTGED